VLNGFGWPHLLIIAVLIILLFGAKRLPDAARGLGRSLQIFKSETRGMRGENEPEPPAAQQPQNPAQNSGFPNPTAYTDTPPQQIAAPQQPVAQPQAQQHEQQQH
jgi:sec-independent protein translocase protein TatA